MPLLGAARIVLHGWMHTSNPQENWRCPNAQICKIYNSTHQDCGLLCIFMCIAVPCHKIGNTHALFARYMESSTCGLPSILKWTFHNASVFAGVLGSIGGGRALDLTGSSLQVGWLPCNIMQGSACCPVICVTLQSFCAAVHAGLWWLQPCEYMMRGSTRQVFAEGDGRNGLTLL